MPSQTSSRSGSDAYLKLPRLTASEVRMFNQCRKSMRGQDFLLEEKGSFDIKRSKIEFSDRSFELPYYWNIDAICEVCIRNRI